MKRFKLFINQRLFLPFSLVDHCEKLIKFGTL